MFRVAVGEDFPLSYAVMQTILAAERAGLSTEEIIGRLATTAKVYRRIRKLVPEQQDTRLIRSLLDDGSTAAEMDRAIRTIFSI